MKILMIGNKESGKTTYMASAFSLLNNGVADFHIETDRETRDWYQRVFESIKHGRYPRASDKRDSHKFRLNCLGRDVLDFEWIDYNGGIIKTIDAHQFMEDIASCDGAMLFFDAKALYDNSPSVHAVRRILTLITQRLEKIEVPLFSVILVVTKVDLLGSINDYSRAIAPLNAFMDNARGNDQIYARIVPISCSKNGFYNTELPILDMLDSGLRVSYISAANKACEHADKGADYASKSGIIDFISSKLRGVATYGEMAESQYKKAQEQLDLFHSIEKPMEKLKSYVESYEITWPVSYGYGKKSKKNSRELIRF